MQEETKIKNFTDLLVWQKAHLIVLEIYAITKEFPREEVFGITNQMRRCAVSITSNIAEGFSRRTNKDKTQFYFISQGSLTELQNQLIISKDINYINTEKYSLLNEEIIIVQKMLSSLIRSLRDSM